MGRDGRAGEGIVTWLGWIIDGVDCERIMKQLETMDHGARKSLLRPQKATICRELGSVDILIPLIYRLDTIDDAVPCRPTPFLLS